MCDATLGRPGHVPCARARSTARTWLFWRLLALADASDSWLLPRPGPAPPGALPMGSACMERIMERPASCLRPLKSQLCICKSGSNISHQIQASGQHLGVHRRDGQLSAG
jgi:hypothetical protein